MSARSRAARECARDARAAAAPLRAAPRRSRPGARPAARASGSGHAPGARGGSRARQRRARPDRTGAAAARAMPARSRAAAATRTSSRSCASSGEYFNPTLAEQPNGDFGETIVRQVLIDALQLAALRAACELARRAPRRHRGEGGEGNALSPALQLRAGWCAWATARAESHARVQRSLERLWRYTRGAVRGRRARSRDGRARHRAASRRRAQPRWSARIDEDARRGDARAPGGPAVFRGSASAASTASTSATCSPRCSTCSAPIRGRAGERARAAAGMQRAHRSRRSRACAAAWRALARCQTRSYRRSASSISASSGSCACGRRRARGRTLADLHRMPGDRATSAQLRAARARGAPASARSRSRQVLVARLEQRLDQRGGARASSRAYGIAPPAAAAQPDARWRAARAVACPSLSSMPLDRDRMHQRVRLDALQGAAPLPRVPGAVRVLQVHLRCCSSIRSRSTAVRPHCRGRRVRARWRSRRRCASEFTASTPGSTSRCGARIDGSEERRTYSIVTPPGGAVLRIGLREQTGGRMSRDLAGGCAPATGSMCGTPMGGFAPRSMPRESGPMSRLPPAAASLRCCRSRRDILAREPRAGSRLIYGNRSTARTMFLEETLALKNRHLGAVRGVFRDEPRAAARAL